MTSELEDNKKFSEFDRIFNPKSIAVIGVSSKGSGYGGGIIRSLQGVGYEGNIFAVNPKGGEFAGIKIYKSMEDIPELIDFAIITVPAQHVPEALEVCRQKGVSGAEILSAGFKETGTKEGIALEEEIKRIAAKGIRVIGPNCFGIYCPKSGLTVVPGPDLSRESGHVAFLSQSGAMTIDFAYMGNWMGIKFSKVVSFGNGSDLRDTELLEYLSVDPETHVICMYIEGVDDGRSFFRILKDTAKRKPVIIYKGGLSEAGKRAVTSHTASMGGNREVWESLLRQCNAVQVNDLIEMANASLAFSQLPARVYKGLSVTGGSGALGVSASDTAEIFGLSVPLFKKDIRDKIDKILPKPGSSSPNPIDVANAYFRPHRLKEVLLHAATDEKIDLHVVIKLLHHYKSLVIKLNLDSVKEVTPYKDLAENLKEVADRSNKPVIVVLPNIRQEVEAIDIEEMMREAKKELLNKGIAVFDDIKEALKAVSHVSVFYSRQQKRS
ncbi:MAG: CoA-binding protein [Spirochaetota bacterium]|nr:CoA-binding protein [Spirochaetota bacterium]